MELVDFAVLAVVAIAAKIGGSPEKITALIMFVWYAADRLCHLLFGVTTFQVLDVPQFALDFVVLVVLARVMLKANRGWLILACGAQFVTVIGHFSMLVADDGMQRAYWAMTQLPAAVMLITLVAGAIAHRFRINRIGPYRQWSY